MKETYEENWGIPLTVITKRNSSGKGRDNKNKKKEVTTNPRQEKVTKMTASFKKTFSIRTITGTSKTVL